MSQKQVRISSVLGNTQRLDGGAMFGNAPRALWERWVEVDEESRILLACRAMLVEWGDCRILCETGIGAYMEPELARRYGVNDSDHKLVASLARLGLKHEDIDYVILSHLHFDHAGGLLPAYGATGTAELLFPRARYVVSQAAWERACRPHPRDRASYIPGLTKKLEDSGRLLLVDGTSVPGLDPQTFEFRLSSGHTPGQFHTVVHGANESIVFAGDLVPGRAWVHMPITMGYDRYPELVIDEKADLYRVAMAGNWRLFFTHDRDCASARIELDAKGRYCATQEADILERHLL